MATYCATIYPAFFVLDVLVYPEVAGTFLWFRILTALIGIATLVASRFPSVTPTMLRRAAQLDAFVGTFGVATMCGLSEGFTSLYLVGLLLCFLALTTVEIFAAVTVVGFQGMLLAVYYAACWFLGPPATSSQIASSIFFGLCGWIFCGVAGVLLFIQRARIQLGKRMIEEQRLDIQRAYDHHREFLRTMTHELRSPLNSILGFAELVRMRETDLAPRSVANLARLEGSAQKLLQIINDILDLSKMEAGRIELNCDAFDLRGVLDEVKESTEALVTKRGVTVTLTAPDSLFLVSDPFRVQQILVNLASNAAKFTPAGEIRISAEPTAHGVRLEVADTGIGVPLEQQQEIFAAFYQGRSVHGREGTGLGLSIVTRLVALLGGTVSMTSRPGSGSTFVVTIPNQQTEARAA